MSGITPLDGEALRATFVTWVAWLKDGPLAGASAIVGNPVPFLEGLSEDELSQFLDQEARRTLGRAAVEDLRYAAGWLRVVHSGALGESLEQGLADLERIAGGFEALLGENDERAGDDTGGGGEGG